VICPQRWKYIYLKLLLNGKSIFTEMLHKKLTTLNNLKNMLLIGQHQMLTERGSFPPLVTY